MKFSVLLFTIILLQKVAADLNSSQINVVTKVLQNAKESKGRYIKFYRTFDGTIPAEVTSLAIAVMTYTDDSYTSLFSSGGLQYDVFDSVATELPWYNELFDGSGTAASVTASGTDSGTVSVTTSNSASTSSHSGSASSTNIGVSSYVPVGVSLLGLVAALI